MERPPGRSLREHPLVRRLPLLVLAAVGIWWWRDSDAGRRELVLQLEGPGWGAVRTLDVQVVDAQGRVLKREERFFGAAPPPELTLEAHLPEGSYRLLVFAGTDGAPPRPPLVVPLTLGAEQYTVRRLRLPPQQR